MKNKILIMILSLCLCNFVIAEENSIQTLKGYFEYLPNAIHSNWIPYKSNTDYKVLVQFRIKKNGEITETKIIESTNPKANDSVLSALKQGSPYKSLPNSYKSESLKAQIELEYKK